MERRIEREVERGKSIMYRAAGMNGHTGGPSPGASRGKYGRSGGSTSKNTAILDEITGISSPSTTQPGPTSSGASPESQSQSQSQLLSLEQENSALLSHYNQSLTQITTAERSLLEISELQSQLVSNLEIQGAQVEQLVSDGLMTRDNVGGGNKELKRASERRSVARGVFWATAGLCAGLVVWDLIF